MKRKNYYFYIPNSEEYLPMQASSFELEALYLVKSNIKGSYQFQYFEKVEYNLNVSGEHSAHCLKVITGSTQPFFHTAQTTNELLEYFKKRGGREVSAKEYFKTRKNAIKNVSLSNMDTIIMNFIILLWTIGIVYTSFCVWAYTEWG